MASCTTKLKVPAKTHLLSEAAGLGVWFSAPSLTRETIPYPVLSRALLAVTCCSLHLALGTSGRLYERDWDGVRDGGSLGRDWYGDHLAWLHDVQQVKSVCGQECLGVERRGLHHLVSRRCYGDSPRGLLGFGLLLLLLLLLLRMRGLVLRRYR